MRCYNCGSEVREDAKFCGVCGSMLDKTECMVCGKEVPKGQWLCAECLESNRRKSKYLEKKNRKSNKGLVISVIILLSIILLALCAVAFVMMRGTFETDKQNEPNDYENEVTEIKKDKKEKDAKREEDEEAGEDDEIEAELEDEEWGEPHFEEIAASSEYKSYTDKSGNVHTYYAENLLDDNTQTTWSPQKNDEMPWVEFSSYSEQKISGIIIENGYSKSSDLYYQNLRAKDIMIECDDWEMLYTLEDLGYRTPEKIKFYEPVITKNIRITVISTYASREIDGVKYDDLSISKIDIY